MQWFENARAGRLTRKRKQILLSRLKTSDCGLQHLHQALVR